MLVCKKCQSRLTIGYNVVCKEHDVEQWFSSLEKAEQAYKTLKQVASEYKWEVIKITVCSDCDFKKEETIYPEES